MAEPAEILEQAVDPTNQLSQPLFANVKGDMEEVGWEEPPLDVRVTPLDAATQEWLESTGEQFQNTLYTLEPRDGSHHMYEALAGIDKEPKLVNEHGQIIATVTDVQALLLALPHKGAVGPPKMRFLVAKTAGKAMHAKLIEAVPDLVKYGPDGQEDAPTLSAVLSTVSLADGSRMQVAAMYTDSFKLCQPQEVAQMLNTLKAHNILPVACSGDLSLL